MKKFKKIYECVREIEINTLYEFKGVNDFNEFDFQHEGECLNEEIIVSKDDLFFTNDGKRVNHLISFNELIYFMELIKALKEEQE